MIHYKIMEYTPEIESFFKENFDKCSYMNALKGHNGDVPTELTCGTIDLLEDFIQKQWGKDSYIERSNTIIIASDSNKKDIESLCSYHEGTLSDIKIIYPFLSVDYFRKYKGSSLGRSNWFIYIITNHQEKIEMRAIRFTEK